MPRTPARITQADIARALRAAKAVGAGAVEVMPDGTILILMEAPPSGGGARATGGRREIVL